MDERKDAAAQGGPTVCPKRIENLDINPADEGYIIYEPEQDRVHFLNPTAVLILELCNGTHSAEEIVELVQEAYGLAESPAEVVSEALKQLTSAGLLV